MGERTAWNKGSSQLGAIKLAEALARIEHRYGARTIARMGVLEDRQGLRRFTTDTSFDRIAGGGIAAGEPLAIVGRAGKLALALRAAAGAQREGGMVLWVDPLSCFDALEATRAGVDLERLIVVRAALPGTAREAAAIALRSEGFRLVVVDAGGALGTPVAPESVAPLVPIVRGSPSSLIVLAENRAPSLALPTYVVERVAWERRFGRTVGWTYAVGRAGSAERAFFHAGALGERQSDLGLAHATPVPLEQAS